MCVSLCIGPLASLSTVTVTVSCDIANRRDFLLFLSRPQLHLDSHADVTMRNYKCEAPDDRRRHDLLSKSNKSVPLPLVTDCG